jgi:cell division initiation protein
MIDLTPLEVRKKKGDFRRAMRGYDPAMVDDFLDLVADRLDELVRENLSLTERVGRQDHQVADYRERERALTEALVTAQEMREEIRRQTTREAELARQGAEQEVSQLRSSTTQELAQQRAKVQQEMAQLRAAVQQEVAEVRASLRTEREREEEALRALRARQQHFMTNYRGFLERELTELGVIVQSSGFGTTGAQHGTPSFGGPPAPSAPVVSGSGVRQTAPLPGDSAFAQDTAFTEDPPPDPFQLSGLEPAGSLGADEPSDEEPFEPEPFEPEPFEPEPFEPEAGDPQASDLGHDELWGSAPAAGAWSADDVGQLPGAELRSDDGVAGDDADDGEDGWESGAWAPGEAWTADDPITGADEPEVEQGADVGELELYDEVSAEGDVGLPGPVGLGNLSLRDEPGVGSAGAAEPSANSHADEAAGDGADDEDTSALLRNAAAAGYTLTDPDLADELLLDDVLIDDPGSAGEGDDVDDGWLPTLLEDEK